MNWHHLGSTVFGIMLTLAACDSPGGGKTTPVLATCNNGALDPGELCDGALVGGQTCQSAGYDLGVLVCNRACTNYDYSGCSGGQPTPDTIDSDTNGPSDTNGASDTSGPSDTAGPNRAPNILSLNANAMTIDAGDTLVVTAVVTDPDGIDDLIGGNLLNAQTGGSYGAFATSAAEGSYTIQLTWEALGVVQPIDTPAAGGPLVLRAEFFDVAGTKAERTLTITLRCDGTGEEGLCDGTCTNLQFDDDRCGTCDTRCVGRFDGNDPEGCVNSVCAVRVAMDPARVNGGATCATLCDEKGLACEWGADKQNAEVVTNDGSDWVGCDERHAGAPATAAYCWCTEGDGVVDPPDPIDPVTATIKGIQSSAASVGCSGSGDVTQGGEVTLEGIVTVGRFTLNTTLAAIFVSDGTQDPYSGLLVRFASTQSWSFTPGQRVRVTGKHQEYFCMTQLAATAITAIGSGTVPAPRTIQKGLDAADLEQWEGMLVQLSNVTVANPTSFPGEVSTDAGVLIDNYILGDSFVIPAAGTHITTLRGALVYDFNKYRVAPRDDADY